jgi:uncharacterized protein
MKDAIEKFFSSPAYAVVGVSTNRKKFGTTVYRMMKDRQFMVYPVNPNHDVVDGERCFATVNDLPEDVQSVVTVVPPAVAEAVLIDCVRKGIQAVWMQPGSDSADAIDIAKRYNLAIVHGQCIIMFLEPVKSFHTFHRWVNRLVGAYPK